MYVASSNGIFIYDGIDKKDPPKAYPISPDLMQCTMTPGALDCNMKGQIVFDIKNNNSHSLKCFYKNKLEEKYDHPLDSQKKLIKFFGPYVIEVKTEKD
jgi:hypothetical protein